MSTAGKVLRSLYYKLNPHQRILIRRLLLLPMDAWDVIRGSRPPLTPPKGMIFVGRGDFVQVGENLLNLIKINCNIQPYHHVLDVGCGIGRLARPLALYLDNRGSYTGFDVVKEGIAWCRKNYREFPNFRFDHIPLYNDLYNREAANTPEAFTFPYPDKSFDVIIFTSVFTHLQPMAAENYTAQAAKTLKPGGYIFATAYIVDNETEMHYAKGVSEFFPVKKGNAYLHSTTVPSANVGYQWEYFLGLFQQAGLINRAFLKGWWCGRPKAHDAIFQDVLVFQLKG